LEGLNIFSITHTKKSIHSAIALHCKPPAARVEVEILFRFFQSKKIEPRGFAFRKPLGFALGRPLGFAIRKSIGSALGRPLGFALGRPIGFALSRPIGFALGRPNKIVAIKKNISSIFLAATGFFLRHPLSFYALAPRLLAWRFAQIFRCPIWC
jgi:hypothetical protein